MAYNANIPQATDQISQSQADLLANFQALSVIATNRLPYLILGPQQVSDPTVTGTQMALYTKTSALTSQPEMFIERQSGSSTVPNPIEFTSYGTSSSGLNTHGFTRLPSGILIKWGRVNAPTIVSDGDAIIYPVAATIPVFAANPFMIQVTGFLSTGATSRVITVNFSQANTTQIAISTIRELVVGSVSSNVTVATLDTSNTYVDYLAIGR